MKNGSFIISLDFELFWGVLDCEDYRRNLNRFRHTRSVIEDLIDVFEKNAIRVTWSTVGLLMMNDAMELKNIQPGILAPSYKNEKLNNYKTYSIIHDTDEYTDDVFFARELVTILKESKYQDIGTHTFSHYYSLEEGQTIEQFNNDLMLAGNLADHIGISLTSIVFPRNQYDYSYIEQLENHNINIFRGNPEKFIYKTRKEDNFFIRALHLIDTYLNIAGNITHTNVGSHEKIFNIKASRFLRPVNRTSHPFKKLQLKRIKDEMTHAAKNNHYYHLWWHPHNFSRFTEENFMFLQSIIEHFNYLNKTYHFSSESMESYVEKVRADG
ncbi:polysaccharide deacetylase family protein [Salinicoccus sp. Marseille-QA3877]